MIEFAILFALGFLTAALIALMLAPAIQRRIVAYTEKRLYATMPISGAEVRAQKDMARALYAAENARLRQELDAERQQAVKLRVRHDDEEVFHRAIESNTQELKVHVATLEKEVTDLNNHLEAKKEEVATLVTKLEISEEVALTRAKEITVLTTKVKHISRELDEVKIQLASRSIEIEHEKSRAQSFKAERDTMSKELVNAEALNKDVAEKVTRESRRATLLEQKLADKASSDADVEMLLERRASEIARLKERLRAATTHVSGKGSGSLVADEAYDNSKGQQLRDEKTVAVAVNETADAGTVEHALEQIRSRSAALSERLRELHDSSQDGALREELAVLAAEMVALTAIREGASSPIRQLIDLGAEQEANGSLAKRAAKHLAAEEA